MGHDVELHWLPLGAGGWFVRLNGRVYELVRAAREGRRPLDLYHSALQLHLPEGRFVIENAWPIPDAAGRARGVAAVGPVFDRRAGRLRVFRYEVRRWADGTIADVGHETGDPDVVSEDPVVGRRILALVDELPTPTWGRDELGTGHMWNSNSVIAWLLASAGLPAVSMRPPDGGRAPGWQAGVVAASRRAHRPTTA